MDRKDCGAVTKDTAKNKLDAIVGARCRALGYCQKCEGSQDLEWAHIVTRRYHSVRWLYENYLCLCSTCHKWGHENQKLFNAWFDSTFLGRRKVINMALQKGEKWDALRMVKLLATL